jgi:hypothetical protein
VYRTATYWTPLSATAARGRASTTWRSPSPSHRLVQRPTPARRDRPRFTSRARGRLLPAQPRGDYRRRVTSEPPLNPARDSHDDRRAGTAHGRCARRCRPSRGFGRQLPAVGQDAGLLAVEGMLRCRYALRSRITCPVGSDDDWISGGLRLCSQDLISWRTRCSLVRVTWLRIVVDEVDAVVIESPTRVALREGRVVTTGEPG